MLGWALRCLAVAVLVGGGFAMLQGQSSAWLDQAISARATKPASAPGTRRATSTDDAWEYVVDAGAHGHFVIDAVVNGVPISFLIDTGASEVILTPDDAVALGFAPHRLDFSRRFRTANGIVRAAPVKLREVRIGQFSLYEVDAAVNEASIGISLLGMSFLERLQGYRVDDGRLILRW
jgi:clan AA aspartic protease (TIGR02281 family)